MASIRSTCNKLFTIFNIVGTTCWDDKFRGVDHLGETFCFQSKARECCNCIANFNQSRKSTLQQCQISFEKVKNIVDNFVVIGILGLVMGHVVSY